MIDSRMVWRTEKRNKIKVVKAGIFLMIKNVVFDIGKVLIGFDWNSYVRSLFDDETADRVSRAIFGDGRWQELDRAVMSVEDIVASFHAADPAVSAEIDEAFGRVGECVTRREWAIPLVDSLKAKGYMVYFLSNMSEYVMGSNPEAFDFTAHMDGGIYSCHVNQIKPDADIYRSITDKYGLVPEECLFIDDHPDNIAAAKQLGWKGIVFRDKEQLEADLDKALTKDRGHDRINVVCYGDSNTYGYDPYTGARYPYEKRWTTLLGEKLGDRYEVIPQGLNGRTTAYDRPGAAWKNGISSFVACLGMNKPVDILTIMLGTNDVNAGLGLSAEQIADGMENLVKLTEENSPELQGYVPRIIVIAPAAIGDNYENSPFAYELTPESVRKSRDIGPLYQKLAEKHFCEFISAVDSVEVSDLDSEHLSEQGHRQLAELIYKTITNEAV